MQKEITSNFSLTNIQQKRRRKKMSVASSSSFSCIKLQISLPQSSSSSSSSTAFRFSTSKYTAFTIRCSQIDGSNLRKPLAPSPPNPPTLAKPVPPSPPSSTSSSPAGSPPPKPVAAVAVEEGKKGNVTLEFQRQKAKELKEYFTQKKLDEAAVQGPFFGFIGKNEISNGRWAMFGFAVGMLTEYATGSDFVQQVQILLSNFGILDLE